MHCCTESQQSRLHALLHRITTLNSNTLYSPEEAQYFHFSTHPQTSPEGHPACSTIGTVVISGRYNGRSVTLDVHPHKAFRLIISTLLLSVLCQSCLVTRRRFSQLTIWTQEIILRLLILLNLMFGKSRVELKESSLYIEPAEAVPFFFLCRLKTDLRKRDRQQ